MTRQAIEDSVAAAGRSREDLSRDASSRPAEVLDFLGAAPGMTILELDAGSGYYTELLSRVVGPQGRVIAHHHPGAATLLGSVLSQRFTGERLRNVERLVARHEALQPAVASIDLVLMATTYHDWYWHDPTVDWGPIDRARVLAALCAGLVPGGVIGVIDHAADAGAGPEATVRALHRIDPEAVKRDFRRAGLELEAESLLLRNAADDRRLDVFDPAIQGRTDRFVFRFRAKPSLRAPA